MKKGKKKKTNTDSLQRNEIWLDRSVYKEKTHLSDQSIYSLRLNRPNVFLSGVKQLRRNEDALFALRFIAELTILPLFSLSNVPRQNTWYMSRIVASFRVQTEISIKSGIFFRQYSPNNELNICICFTQIPPFSWLLIRSEQFIRFLLYIYAKQTQKYE